MTLGGGVTFMTEGGWIFVPASVVGQCSPLYPGFRNVIESLQNIWSHLTYLCNSFKAADLQNILKSLVNAVDYAKKNDVLPTILSTE